MVLQRMLSSLGLCAWERTRGLYCVVGGARVGAHIDVKSSGIVL
jgi:hypothetical protein